MPVTDGALTATEKLVWLGLRSPQSSENEGSNDTDRFQRGTGPYDQFRDDLTGGPGGRFDQDGDGTADPIDSYEEFNRYLQDNGYSSEEAAGITDAARDQHGNFDSYKEYLTEDADGYEDTNLNYGSGGEYPDFQEGVLGPDRQAGNGTNGAQNWEEYEQYLNEQNAGVGGAQNWEEYEQSLIDQGYSPEKAAERVRSLKNQYGNGQAGFDRFSEEQTAKKIESLKGRYGSDPASFGAFQRGAENAQNWEEYEQSLIDQGYSPEEAAARVDSLKGQYGDGQAGFDSYQSDVTGSNGWDGYEDALIDQGYSPEEAASEVSAMQEGHSYAGFEAQNGGEAQSWQEYRENLVDNGWSEQEADAHVKRLQDQYGDDQAGFDSYKETVDGTGSYPEYENQFPNQTTIGGDVTDDQGRRLGIRIFESPGTTRNAVSAPRGAVEVFGTQVHFSRADALTEEFIVNAIDYNNIRGFVVRYPKGVPDERSITNPPDPIRAGDSIRFTCEIENLGDVELQAIAPLVLDGETVQQQTVTLRGGQTRTISFTREAEIGQHSATIFKQPLIRYTVEPEYIGSFGDPDDPPNDPGSGGGVV